MRAADSPTAPSPRSFRAEQQRKRRSSEQVAAVCYRIGRNGIEFLLVQTRNGRWTFPKGGAEPGLTHAEAAAMEAFEEAGVHGRIEQIPFAHYTRRKQRASEEILVHAHLCEVLHLVPPQESNRMPTWFSAEKARRRLRESRDAESAVELSQVVNRAVRRIRRLAAASDAGADALRKVQFEPLAEGHGLLLQVPFARFARQRYGNQLHARAIEAQRLASSRNSRLLPAAEEQDD